MKKKKKYKNSGVLRIGTFMEEEHTFLDYLRGGYDINFTVAIDFTASNGKPHLPSSLHYNNPMQPNQYVQAITSVGKVIQDYDT